MAGGYDGYIGVAQLSGHGDFGLGTFDRLDGEMIVVDNTIYQITSDSFARKAACSVLHLLQRSHSSTKTSPPPSAKKRLFQRCRHTWTPYCPSKNLFYAIRIDGLFRRIKTRSVPAG